MKQPTAEWSDRDIEYWLQTPEWAADAIFVDLEVGFNLRDILALLIRRGRFLITIKVHTEYSPVGRVDSRARVLFPPITFPWRRHPKPQLSTSSTQPPPPLP